jgi:cytochrome c551/c552
MNGGSIILFLFTILTFTAFGQKEEKVYYNSGELQLLSKFDSACHCAKVTEYYQSGKIYSSKTVPLDGADINYYEDGVIMGYYFWRGGAPDGRIYSNFSSGKLGYEKFYSNKFKSGTWKYFNEDGTLSKEQIFEEEKTSWDSDLDYVTNKYYLKGKLAYTEKVLGGRKSTSIVNDNESYRKLIANQTPLGETLFIQNCAACHSADADIVGPKLKGVTENRTDDWLKKMIINGDKLIQSGDKDAVTLFHKWDRIQHPDFERLTKDEVKAIIDYLKTFK